MVVDDRGNLYVADVNRKAIYKIANSLPVALFTAAPTSGSAPLTVRFDGSASRDPDGSITGYSWDFGDGTKGTGKTTSHIYTRAGSFTIKLTVTDNSGALSKTLTKTITVTA